MAPRIKEATARRPRLLGKAPTPPPQMQAVAQARWWSLGASDVSLAWELLSRDCLESDLREKLEGPRLRSPRWF